MISFNWMILLPKRQPGSNVIQHQTALFFCSAETNSCNEDDGDHINKQRLTILIRRHDKRKGRWQNRNKPNNELQKST